MAVSPAGMLVTKTTSADLTPYLHSSPPRQSAVSSTSDVNICTETAVSINDVIGNKTAVVYADDVTDNESAVVACCDVTDNDVTTDDDTVVGGGGAYQVLLQTSLTISNLDTTLSQQQPREVYKMAATSTSAPSVGEMLNPKELVHASAVEEGLVDETDDVFVKDDDHRLDRQRFCGSLMTEHYIRNVGQIIKLFSLREGGDIGLFVMLAPKFFTIFYSLANQLCGLFLN